jgi:hypothetical protein
VSPYTRGVRAGYADGKDRAGAYVIGEEFDLADQAAIASGLPEYDDNEKRTHGYDRRADFARGYRRAYRHAAEGYTIEPRGFWVAP